MGCNTWSDIREPDMADLAGPGPGHQDRHAFAGVVAADPGGIIAMIGGDHHQIVKAQTLQQLGQFGVEPYKCACIARHIAAMTIFAVKLDKIRKNERTFRRGVDLRGKVLHQRGVWTFVHVVDAGHGEDVADLAKGDHRLAGVLHPVCQHRLGWCDGKIASIGRAFESALLPDERPRDDTADPAFMHHRREILAEPQQAVEAKTLLMRRNLHDTVSRGIADRFAAAQMLGPERLDHLDAVAMTIAKNAIRARQLADTFGDFGWEGRLGIRQIGPVPRDRKTCQFPMARRCVLATRNLGRGGPAAVRCRCQARRGLAAGEFGGAAKTQRVQGRHGQRAAASGLGPAFRAGHGDVPHGVCPGIRRASVEERLGIGCTTDSHRIHDDQERSAHVTCSSTRSGAVIRPRSSVIAARTARAAASACPSRAAWMRASGWPLLIVSPMETTSLSPTAGSTVSVSTCRPPPSATTARPSASPSIAATVPEFDAGTSRITGASGRKRDQSSTKRTGPPIAYTIAPNFSAAAPELIASRSLSTPLSIPA